jgi:hypothetical protein
MVYNFINILYGFGLWVMQLFLRKRRMRFLMLMLKWTRPGYDLCIIWMVRDVVGTTKFREKKKLVAFFIKWDFAD